MARDSIFQFSSPPFLFLFQMLYFIYSKKQIKVTKHYVNQKNTSRRCRHDFKYFDTARQFMHATGNPTQWNANYPALEDLEPDIQNGNSYVCVENDKVVATFTLIIGDEPNYQLIENGSWRSEAPYGTVHRLASDGTTKGIARACFNFCKTQISHLRVDTHKDNQPMQACFKQNGFEECGIIYVSDGTPRIAYEFIRISE